MLVNVCGNTFARFIYIYDIGMHIEQEVESCSINNIEKPFVIYIIYTQTYTNLFNRQVALRKCLKGYLISLYI